MDNNCCRKCGKNPVVHGIAAWNDGLCPNCSAEFDERVLDLSIKRMFGLSDWQFFLECKLLGWHFNIDPEIVREYVIEIEG